MPCWLCGTFNDCDCPTPEQDAKRQRILEQNRCQKNHEESVRRQRSKLKIAPWRKEEDNANGS